MKIFRRFLICALLLCSGLAVHNVHAVPATPDPVTVMQPDGTLLTIRIYGDEWGIYTTTDDGYGIMRAEDGFFHYVDTKGNILPVKAKNSSALTAADRAAMRNASIGVPWSELARIRQEAMDREMRNVPMMSSRDVSILGVNKTLVLLVSYPDHPFSLANPSDYYNRFLNGREFTDNNATGSVWNYYNDNSAGQFDPQFTVAGPYTAPGNHDAWFPDKDNPNAPSRNRVPELIGGVLQQMADEGFDFSPFVDNGVIHDVFMIFSYGNQAEGNTGIHPHKSNLNTTINGIYFETYGCTSELRGSVQQQQIAGIGTFAHEYGHIIGLPDYYDTLNNGTPSNVVVPSSYFLMDMGSYNNNGRTPPPLSIINRYILGWIEPTTIEEPGQYTLPALIENKGFIIRVSNDDDLDGEYFTLETRSTEASVWDQRLGYDGLFVMHIDRTRRYIGSWRNNRLNTDVSHPCARPVRAEENRSLGRWVFPGVRGNTALSESSHEYFAAWNGTPHGYELSDIAYENGKVTFTLNIKGRFAEIVDNYVNQNDAEFSWDGGAEGITYNAKVLSQNRVVFSTTVNEPNLYVPNLVADTEYVLNITSMNGETAVQEETIEFRTLPVVGDFAYMKIKGSYGANEQVPLHIFDVQGELDSIAWKVDDKDVLPPSAKLNAGRHKITATVTTKDNKVEVITKYVTIQ